MPSNAIEYHDAALERMRDARELKQLERYSLAMYAAGVAAECMLRAFRHQDRPHDSHHDVVALLAACDREQLGEHAWAKLRGHVQTVHLLWLNNFRYKNEARLRKHLSELRYYERLKRGSDTLKVACIELTEAALGIVTIGYERWRILSKKK